MKKECFPENKFSSLYKASLQKWEGGKYAGGSWPSCSTSIESYSIKCNKKHRNHNHVWFST